MATGRIPTTANSPLTAKGDLFTFSTGSAKLAVGSNGDTLVADSSTTTGLRWQGDYAAGKNKIINGDYGVWQRGTSFTASSSDLYTSDRWILLDYTGGSTVCSRETFTAGTAPVSGYEGSFYAQLVRSGSPTSGNTSFAQRIENVRTFAGQTVTVSFWAKASASLSFFSEVDQNFGGGGSSTVFGSATTFTATTSWQRFTYTTNVASISGKTIGTNSYLYLNFNVGFAAGAFTLQIWGVQLEAGSTATAFQTATGTIQGELAACQRYYVRFNATGTYPYSVFTVSGNTENSTTCIGITSLPVELRTIPSSVEYGGTITINPLSGSSGTVTSISLHDRTNNKYVSIAWVSSGLTTGLWAYVRANNSSTAYLGISAEL